MFCCLFVVEQRRTLEQGNMRYSNWHIGIILALTCLLVLLDAVNSKVVYNDGASVDSDLTSELHEQIRRSRVRRVIGGSEVKTGQYPHLVAVRAHIPLRYFGPFAVAYEDVYCGGSIINSRWIVTAAHCFSIAGISTTDLMNPQNWYIKAGDSRLSFTLPQRLCALWNTVTKSTNIHCWYVTASKIILHPQFSVQDNYLNDIALIKLSINLPSSVIDPSVGAIPLPPSSLTTSWPQPGLNCTVAGWGCTADGGSVQPVARSVVMPTVNDAQCGQLIQPAIGQSRICAGYLRANTGICKGDSGSPLTCFDATSSRWLFAGVASSTSADVPAQVPGVFTRVSYYVAWINTTIATN